MANETYTNARKLAENEVNKVGAINNALDDLGQAMDFVLVKALSSNAVSVSVNELKACGVLRVTGALTANGTVTIAAGLYKKFQLENATTGSFTLTVKVLGQTGAVLPASTQGATVGLRANGTDVVSTGSAATISGLSTVATTGDYNDLSNKPTLGTAAPKNVGTGSGDVAAGNRGLPAGGTVGQILSKVDATNYNATWDDSSTQKILTGARIFRNRFEWNSLSGSGALFASDDSIGGVGEVWTAGTGTTTTGGSAVSVNPAGNINNTQGCVPLNTVPNAMTAAAWVYIPTLSGGSDTFNTYLMLVSSLTSASTVPVTFIGFRISGSNIQAVHSNSGTETSVNLASVAANTWYKLRLVYTSSGTQFYLDNIVATTIATNTPGSSTAMRYLALVQKTAGTTAVAAKWARPAFEVI